MTRHSGGSLFELRHFPRTELSAGYTPPATTVPVRDRDSVSAISIHYTYVQICGLWALVRTDAQTT